MGRLLAVSTLIPLFVLSAPARADEALCGETFTAIDVLEQAIKGKPGIKVLPSDDTVVSYSDPATSFIWNFATASNAAFPSVACRRLVSAGDRFDVLTEISCAADKAACDRLAASYNELDRQMREAAGK